MDRCLEKRINEGEMHAACQCMDELMFAWIIRWMMWRVYLRLLDNLIDRPLQMTESNDTIKAVIDANKN